MRLRAAMLAGATMMLFAGAAGPAAAQAPAWLTPEFLADYFIGIANDPVRLRAQTEDIYGPVPDPIWAVMARHISGAILRPGYVDYLYAQAAQVVTAATTEADVVGLGVAIDQRATIAGVVRLPQKKQEAFLRVARDVFAWTAANHPEECQAMLLEDDLVDAARHEFQFLIAQEPAYVDAYYTIVYQALAAEVDDDPAPRRLPDGVDDVPALGAYNAAIIAMVADHEDGTAMLMAIGGDAAADPTLFCDFGVMTVDALWTLSPDDRDRVLIGIMQEAVNTLPDLVP